MEGTEDVDEATLLPPKLTRSSCIFECEDTDPELNSPQDRASWERLLKAAEIRRHDGILMIAATTKEDEIPQVLYHRQCRNQFVKKRDLDAIQKVASAEKPKRRELNRRKSSAELSSSSSRVYDPVCIFCLKSSKYLTNSKTREPLVQCVELRSDQTVRQAAVEKNDSRIIAIASRDLVAAEGHYHRSCYRRYTKKTSSKTNSETSDDSMAFYTDPDEEYAMTEEQCYNGLFRFIRDVIFEEPQVIKMTELCKHLLDLFVESGVGLNEVKASTKKHIHRKIKGEFGESIHVIPDERGKLLVYPDNLSTSQLVKENERLKEELLAKKQNTSNENMQMRNVSTILRNDVKQHDVQMPWPPLPEEMKEGAAFIPGSLKIFLRMLMAGESDPLAPVSDRIQRLIGSIGQDIVYCITSGKIIPPKHIMWPYAVKSLTGCVEIIRLLNRSGHGVSRSKLQEFDTALCLHKMSMNDGSVAIPRDIKPNVQVTLAYDNIDRLEETLSGGGTSHRVNGIIIQPRVFGPLPFMQCSLNEEKRKLGPIEIEEPRLLPIYNAGKRVGPPLRRYVEINDQTLKQEVNKKNLLWLLTRAHCASNQTVASWTGFNIQVRDEVKVTSDEVGYLPTLNAPATELSTVHEVLCQSQLIRRSLGLESIVVVFDQALYAKATEIIWKHRDTFSEVIPRMGAFHTLCTLLNIIGKRFQDAGLRDLCIESGIIAEGSVEKLLLGKQYNRAVRFHKLLYEALQRLAWKGFVESQSSDETGNLESLVNTFSLEICQKTFTETLNSPVFLLLAESFETYKDSLRQHEGPLASFWMSYLDIVDIMLNILRASREGNWDLHLSAIHDMIPWCFAYDKHNYARYLSTYYNDMTTLSQEHPDAFEHLRNGGFSVQIGPDNPFGRIPVDQTIEETINKDTQTPGGTKGFSLKPSAVHRYYLTAEFRSTFLGLLRDTLGSDNSFSHPDLTAPRMRKDEKDVSALVSMLGRNWTNPFGEPSELISLSTGLASPDNISKDLLGAKDKGTVAFKNFCDERLDVSATKGFYDPLKKQRLKTFSDIKVKRSFKTQGRCIIMKADRNLFAKMTLIGQTRKLDMKEVLSYRLGPIPWALANPDGTLRKTNKAQLSHRLAKDFSPVDTIPSNSACIIDGMAIVQKVMANSTNASFGEASKSIFSAVLREGRANHRIDVVFDIYKDNSIKYAERVRRGSESAMSFGKIASGHRLKQWKIFLQSGNNKTQLIDFLVDNWSNDQSLREKLERKELFLTHGEQCLKVTKDSISDVQDLHSSQEEADTRILLHAEHCGRSGLAAAVIISPDTDVFILAMAFTPKLKCPVYFKLGSKTRTEYMEVKKAVDALGHDKCACLLGLHSFTGCDTVSSFAGRGKVSALGLLNHEKHMTTLQSLGQSWNLSNESLQLLETLTCSLYSPKTAVNSVNELRFNIFCAKKGEAESWQLPPCASSLLNHCKRANYQCAIWKRSLSRNPDIPSPVGHGWRVDDGQLVIDWGDASPAPEAVMELIACNCPRKCLKESCTCLQNGMSCTYLCKLPTCSNMQEEEEEEPGKIDFEGSSDDDDDE